MLTPRNIWWVVRQLGDSPFERRQSASVRLSLIGQPALHHLEAAANSPDREVAHRSRGLIRHIKQTLTARRTDFLAGNLLARLRPTLFYVADADTTAGRRTDVILAQLADDEVAYGPQMRVLLGAQWNRIRLVPVDHQVAVLIGSNVKLLDETVENLVHGRSGLAARPELAAFQGGHGARQLELHVSAGRLLVLVGEHQAAFQLLTRHSHPSDSRPLPIACTSTCGCLSKK